MHSYKFTKSEILKNFTTDNSKKSYIWYTALTLSSQNYDLLDLPHCISFNIEGIYHLIPKLTSNPQKWPWPWTHLEVSEKWKSSFKKSFFSLINWNFILRRFRKFLISCFLRNSKIPNGLGKTAVLQNQQSFIFERRKFFIRFRF